MTEKLKEAEAFFLQDAKVSGEETVFEAAQCLQCGLCLEVCPNFAAGETFGGMAAMTTLTRLLAKANKAEQKRLRKAYGRFVYADCGKSLACRDICPAGLDMEKLLVRGNAAAIWRRWSR